MTLRSLAGAAAAHVESRRRRRRLALPRLLRAFADVTPGAVFVEIGANDGKQHDPLRPFVLARGWTGVMVEPVPYVFERLRGNYAGIAGVRLEQAAIADRDGTLPFFHLVDATPEERAELPEFYDGVGSFSREQVLGHAKHMADIEQRLVCLPVPALTYASLLRRHGLERVDLLLVDTEGYDWEIIRHLDLADRPPTVLIYEHFHLSAADRDACAAHLRAAGYRTLEEGFDTMCVHRTADPRLRRRFDRMRPAFPGVTVRDEPA